MTRAGVMALLAVALLARPAAGDPAALVLRELPAPPPPHSLAIVRSAARAAPRRPQARMPTAPRPPARDGAPPISAPDAPVRVRLELGFAVDGARPTTRPTLAGGELDGYQAIRPFATGAAFLSTHGLIATPLTTYLALGFRLAPTLAAVAPLAASLDRTDDVQLRAAWADAERPIAGGRLGTLHVRAGRLYNYATWPLHVDGLDATWAARGLTVAGLAGYRVDDYRPADAADREPIGALGLRVAVDLGARRLLPATLSAAMLRLGPRVIGTLALDHRFTDRASLRADVRIIDGAATHEALLVRAELGDDVAVAIDVVNQASDDWRFGPAFVAPTDPGAPRGYLEFAAPAPTVTLTARAGVVLLGNLDLLGRVGAGVTRADTGDLHAADWLEGGLAAEVRARRTIAIGASLLMRDTDRADRPADVDAAGPQPLDLRGSGDESFIEAGTSARLGLGLRRLSTSLELYGRRIRYATRYVEPGAPRVDPAALPVEWRAGGRVAIDAWMTPRVRARIGYDLSSTLDVAPEIAGYKSLRLTLEGSFD